MATLEDGKPVHSPPWNADIKHDESTSDQEILRAQGHIEEMPRQFSLLAILGLAFSITNSWIGIFATFQQPFQAGGGPGVFYALLVASGACFIITIGLAELASAFPSSGGQYHFAFMLSTRSTRAFAAFITGWMSILAWVLTTASSSIYMAEMFAYLAAAYHEDYTPTAWHVWLMYVAVTVSCATITIFLPTAMPRLEKTFFFCSITGFVTFLITILATATPKHDSHTIFAEYNNLSGWNDGAAFLISCGTAMYAFIGTDGAIHIAEEVPNPSRNVPRTMCLTMMIGILTAVPWSITFLFCGGDLDKLGNSTQPIRLLFLQATHNPSVATFFTCWLMVIYYGATLSCLAATGRQTWAFARDHGLPFSSWIGVIHSTLKMPLNATIACTIIISLYGIIYVGSTRAFNSFISASVLVMNISYAIPQGIALFRGREKVLPPRKFDLGRFGYFANAFAVTWVAAYTVLFCFPFQYPTTVQSMNYVSVVVVGICVIISAIWLGGKKKSFTGPDIDIDMSELSGSETCS